MNLESIIKEEVSKFLNESYEYLPYDSDGDNYEYDELGIDKYEVSDQVEKIAKSLGVNILSDKFLAGILYDTDTSQAIGGLWVSNDNYSFSFDIAIAKEYQNKGLSYKLIDNAIDIYNYQNMAYSEMNKGKKLPMKVDVINPLLANILKTKYGFRVIKRISSTRALMSK